MSTLGILPSFRDPKRHGMKADLNASLLLGFSNVSNFAALTLQAGLLMLTSSFLCNKYNVYFTIVVSCKYKLNIAFLHQSLTLLLFLHHFLSCSWYLFLMYIPLFSRFHFCLTQEQIPACLSFPCCYPQL